MKTVRQAVKSAMPVPVVRLIGGLRRRLMRAKFSGLNPSEAFQLVYAGRLWGSSQDPDHPFNSGTGSSDAEVVASYVNSVRRWLDGLSRKPDVADIGCGDFRVGSQIRPSCGRYVAYDCVGDLIESNKARWADRGVEFRVLDASAGKPDRTDVVFIRQVLQHLPNQLISQLVANVVPQCSWLIVTEHLPEGNFVANVDKPIGPDIRCTTGSGVVLTEPPFSIRPMESFELCRVASDSGFIVTNAYRMS
jgi:SAM-dependent methyltransferase